MSMYDGVPPAKQQQFEEFMIAYSNTRVVADAVTDWIREMPRREDLSDREILAPPHQWLSTRTGLTDGMLATTLLALFASGGIVPHPRHADVWILSGEGEIDPDAARDRLMTVLDVITSSGHHRTLQDRTAPPDRTPNPTAPTPPPWRRLIRRFRPRTRDSGPARQQNPAHE